MTSDAWGWNRALSTIASALNSSKAEVLEWRFLAFEGPPGAGKSTLLRACGPRLERCFVGREIEDPPIPKGSEYIRLEQGRRELINRSVGRGFSYVSDRSVVSTLVVTMTKERWAVDQRKPRGELSETVAAFARLAERRALRIPSVVLHLDVSASEARRRQLARDMERHDSVWVREPFIEAMREAYAAVYSVLSEASKVSVLRAVAPDNSTGEYMGFVESTVSGITGRSWSGYWEPWP